MAVRTLTRDPAFTLTAVAILAIGIGANSTMFSIVRCVLLRPVPWGEPDRLALLQEVQRDSGDASNPSTANYVDVRDQSDVFEQTAAFRFVYFNLSDGRADSERVQGLRVTPISSKFEPNHLLAAAGSRGATGRNVTCLNYGVGDWPCHVRQPNANQNQPKTACDTPKVRSLNAWKIPYRVKARQVPRKSGTG
jgi:hypothetical protein